MRPPSSVSGPGKDSRPPRGNGRSSSTQRSNSRKPHNASSAERSRSSSTGGRSPSTDQRSGGDRRGPQRKNSDGRVSSQRDSRNEKRPRRIFDNPPLPDDLDVKSLPSRVKTGLRALSPENAEVVGKELLMVIRFLDQASDESLASAFRYAKSAAARAGRVGVVREFEGKVALKQGKYQEAKTALRAAHRILGEDSILIDIAAAELGLERPAKALEILGEVDANKIEKERLIEARIISAWARLASGQRDAALVSVTEKDRDFLEGRLGNPQLRGNAERILRSWHEVHEAITAKSE